MLSFLRKKQEQKDYIICNMLIERDETTTYNEKFENTSDFIGEFHLLNTGKLIRGRSDLFHTNKTKLGYLEDHIHIKPSGAILDLARNEDGEPYLDAKYKTPHLTLKGLYKAIEGKDIEKSRALEETIKVFIPEFKFNSISTREETRVKLLENTYKRYISDQ